MHSKLTRSKIARYTATQLLDGNRDVVNEVAAYLVQSGRVRETDLLLRSIYGELEQHGVVLADVTAAQEITADVEEAIKEITGARQLALRHHQDQNVIGGIRLETPSKVLDATVARRINTLRERKI